MGSYFGIIKFNVDKNVRGDASPRQVMFPLFTIRVGFVKDKVEMIDALVPGSWSSLPARLFMLKRSTSIVVCW